MMGTIGGNGAAHAATEAPDPPHTHTAGNIPLLTMIQAGTGETGAVELAIAAWLHAKEQKSQSVKTRATYNAILAEFRQALRAEGLDLDAADPRCVRAAASGAFVGIAHPTWYTLTPTDARSIAAAHAIEVYNAGTADWNDRGDAWYLCDLLLAGGRRLHAYAADDAHFLSTRPTAFAAWVQVRAAALTPEALLAALKAGEYYSSQGPELHQVAIVGSEITIACSPAQAIVLAGPSAHACSLRGEGVTTATFSLEGFTGSYCRVTVIDQQGRRAWSNPIWLDR